MLKDAIKSGPSTAIEHENHIMQYCLDLWRATDCLGGTLHTLVSVRVLSYNRFLTTLFSEFSIYMNNCIHLLDSLSGTHYDYYWH